MPLQIEHDDKPIASASVAQVDGASEIDPSSDFTLAHPPVLVLEPNPVRTPVDGASEIDSSKSGEHVKSTTTRDHIEVTSGCNFAAVSDRGLRHEDNQDAVAITSVEILCSPVDVPPIYIAVVCDGVSSCEMGASASAGAARTVAVGLKDAYTRNPACNPRTELRNSIGRANDAVHAIPCTPDSPKDPPSTTVVAAVVQDGVATIGWIGDSRAYWVTDEEAGVLTRDDSWINAMLDAGYMTEEQAAESPNQSALYRCLGGDVDPDNPSMEPSYVTFRMNPGTRLILCSDGFWNYAPTPEEVAKLVRQAPQHDAFKIAKHLVNYAIVGGGHDNITVAVLSQ